jgi:riboflavin kinase / FMN adenylyltransferase
MQLIRDIQNLKTRQSFIGGVVTIGKYDGLHLGHRRVLMRLLDKARELNLPAIVITFEPMPYEYLRRESMPTRLMGIGQKIFTLQSLGFEKIICLRFNQALANLSAEDFIKKILVDALKIKYVIVGKDFAFGCRRQGDSALLEKLGANYGFATEIIPALEVAGVNVSSSTIRNTLEKGDLLLAKEFLGQYYTLMGRVAYGLKYGHDIGFPTANIFLQNKVAPLSGVYVVRVRGLDRKFYNGIANVGFRPTLALDQKLLEVHIFDFKENIYGKRIFVDFLHKLRDEKKFSNFVFLKQQIARDVIAAKQFLSSELV